MADKTPESNPYKDQSVKSIKIKDLVLWTENPRDPIDPDSTDQEFFNRAIGKKYQQWKIDKLAAQMGEYYDFSELPTVVYHGKKPVVYDGNRRMLLGKLKLKYIKIDKAKFDLTLIPEFPLEVPCNVCSEEIALKNVYRKHGESGSWKPLERDIFMHKYMHAPKSIFLLMEENTGLITAHPHMNQGFVKKEIFQEGILKKLGFEFSGDKLFTTHTDKQAESILNDISQKVSDREISTRESRGDVLGVLDKKTLELIDKNAEHDQQHVKINFKSGKKGRGTEAKGRVTKRRQKKEESFFGGKLYLEQGDVSDLYRDIADLYDYYLENRGQLSVYFPGLIRMSLRLLCEAAANSQNTTMDKYLKAHFPVAKGKLNKDLKTTLSSHNVTESSILQLLQTGAHAYKSSNNVHQTIAMSIILGEMIKITHGKTK